MRILLLALFISFSFLSILSFASNGEKSSYTIVEVVTPSKEIYDDGIYRTQFSSFYIIDENGNKIASSGEVFDYAAKLKLSEGNYTIFYRKLNDELVQKELKVKKGNYLRIVLQ